MPQLYQDFIEEKQGMLSESSEYHLIKFIQSLYSFICTKLFSITVEITKYELICLSPYYFIPL